MKHLAIACALVAALTACDVSAESENMHEHLTRSMPSRGITAVDITNVSGTIDVRPSKGNTITVDATKNGASAESLARTHVNINRSASTLSIETNYEGESGGGWFSFHRNGGSVDYHISIPASMSLKINNVSGSIRLAGIQGDVDASDVSGSIDASLGRVAGTRRVRLDAVSGAIAAGIARTSDVRIKATAISGTIRQFADGDVHDARLGSGSASMNLSTISGSITVSPQ